MGNNAVVSILESTGITALLFQMVTPANINITIMVIIRAIRVMPFCFFISFIFCVLLSIYLFIYYVHGILYCSTCQYLFYDICVTFFDFNDLLLL